MKTPFAQETQSFFQMASYPTGPGPGGGYHERVYRAEAGYLPTDRLKAERHSVTEMPSY